MSCLFGAQGAQVSMQTGLWILLETKDLEQAAVLPVRGGLCAHPCNDRAACSVWKARASFTQASQHSSKKHNVLVPYWALQSAHQHCPSQWHACTLEWPAACLPAG